MTQDLVIDAKLNKDSYDYNNTGVGAVDGVGYARIAVTRYQPDPTGAGSNFAAQLYKAADGSYHLAYRGTSDWGAGDRDVNFKGIFGGQWTAEMTESIKFTYAAIKRIQELEGGTFDQARARLFLTGHSQGGFEAELNAKFFGLGGTSLDGPGAAGHVGLSGWNDLKTWVSAQEPTMQQDYIVGDFLARRYTIIVGGVNQHVTGVVPDNSILNLIVGGVLLTINPLASVALQGAYIHRINNIIDVEMARKNNQILFWLTEGDTPDVMFKIGGLMYPTVLTSADGTVTDTGSAFPLVVPRAEVLARIQAFLRDESGGNAKVYSRDGVTYVEGDKGTLLIRADGTGERWVKTPSTVRQDILGVDGQVTDRVETSTFGSALTVTTTYKYDAATNGLLPVQKISQTVNADQSVTRVVTDGKDQVLVTSVVRKTVAGDLEFVDTYPDGRVVVGNQDVVTQLAKKQASADEQLLQTLTTVSDALALLAAIKSGQPLPIVASGLRLATHFDSSTNLSGASNVASGVLSLVNLSNALERGDTIGAVTAGANAVVYGATAYANFAENVVSSKEAGTAIAQAFGADSGLALVEKALPYLNLINSIAQGDAIGTVTSLLMLNPVTAPYAIAINIVRTVFGLFGDDDSVPDPWGSGRFVWRNGGIAIDSAGQTGGNEAVSGAMNNVLTVLNQLITTQHAQNPTLQLGLIANRMPTLGYDLSGFRFADIDPLTGQEKHPSLRFDTSGRPYNATPGSPESFQSLVVAMAYSALARGAIAPQWEVDTARLQTQYGDPKAGLTEEERAARDGQLAAPLTGSTQVFRPIVLDMDGDGIETWSQAEGVAFDVDDSGYLKQTGWVKSDDAFLTLDRNYNGKIDSGRELFSNSTVSLDKRGLAGLEWVDADHNGLINSADPVWNELRLWRDTNKNGVQDAGELQSLSAAGVTELNYAMGQYTKGGVSKLMSSPDLTANKDGTAVHVVPEGIVIQSSSNGSVSLLVTAVNDKTAVQANRDGITTYEDTEAIVSATDLLANDTLGGFTGRDMSLTSVANFRHGTAYVDANGFVHFTPEANYNGTGAGFDYTAVATANGQAGSGTVDVTVNSVNDAPTLGSVNHTTKPIYGYKPVYTTSTNPDTGQSTETYVYDVPLYNPYATYTYYVLVPYYDSMVYQPRTGYIENPPAGIAAYTYYSTPVATEDTGAGSVVGSDVDDPAAALTYEVVGQPQYGGLIFNSDGTFQYTSWKAPGVASDRIIENGQYGPTQLSNNGVYPTTDVFQVKITDPHGASSIQSISVTHFGSYTPPTPPSGGGGKKPIAVDLNNNGFNFTNVSDSNVFFDVNGDGWKRRTAWIGGSDGLLAYDVDGNGKIETGNEIAFSEYKPGAQSDLDGLRAFDTNGNGLFDAGDAKWGKFGVWQDANQNGVTDAGEFRSLADMGVASINLQSNGQQSIVNGQTVHGLGSMQMTNGSSLAIADVTLGYSLEMKVPTQPGSNQYTTGQAAFSPDGEVLDGTPDKDLILGKNGNNVIHGFAGDDVIMEDGGNDVIEGGDGNDLIYSGADNDLVSGDAGDDAIYAGLGNDVVFGGDGHDAIFAEGGNDVVFGGAGNDLISGGSGNDVLDGDDGNDQIYGESGYDALFGRDGDDELSGLDGNDRLDGGAGNDLLDGGTGDDEMIGGTGDDVYVVDSWQDVVTENVGEGTDTVRTNLNGYVLGATLENLTLTDGVNAANPGSDTDSANPRVAKSATGNASNNVLIGNTQNNTLSGLAGDDTLDGGLGADTMIGGVGNDTYVVDNVGDIVTEYSNEGTDLVQSSVSYTLSANVENLTLTGTAAINGTGNTLNNVLTGNAAANTLDGGAGNDIMTGGAGNDIYVVDSVGDVIVENAGEGIDTVQSSVTWTLGAELENLTLTGAAVINGTGNALNNILVGNAQNNILTALAGDDTLDGGAGVDTMIGGTGNDTYVVDNVGDVVTENASEGTDLVQSSVTYTLSANVENLTLTGSANINGTGNSLNNVLVGNSGNNYLDGGTGADSMSGGAGDDTYRVDGLNDTVSELSGGGTDTVEFAMSGAAYTYTLGANVENLSLIGNWDLIGIGNELDNIIFGNSGNNRLEGGAGNDHLSGGSGADTMLGGAGDDSYVVDVTGVSGNDVVIENANEGTDLVLSYLSSYTLTANVENLLLGASSATISGTGNELANTITGNAYNNTLDGGLGADTMIGGVGNDTYVVDNVGDIVTEYSNEGTDLVQSSVSYTLSANVENLTLTGTAAINGTGNTLNNVLTGNAAANTLDGGAGNDTMTGGAGNDTLKGGLGNDTYWFGRGDGSDLLQENDATQGNTDVAFFQPGVTCDQLWFRRISGTNDLEVSIIGTTDKVTIQNWYAGSQYHVEQFKTTDGSKTLSDGKVQALVDAMAAFAPPAVGQTTLPSNYQTSLNPVIAANWA